MEKNIGEIYSKLSGGKQIASEEQIISKRDFNSIMIDRFRAELSKMGINWNGEDIQAKNLIPGNATISVSEKSNGANYHSITATNKDSAANLSVGIDIQSITELPESDDYWEDEFYKMKFKPEEIGYCVKKENARQSFAGIYAAKEALIKCDNRLNWEDILISHDENGKPICNGFAVSISHSDDVAIAAVLKNVSGNKQNNEVVETVSKAVETNTPKSYGKFYFAAILIIIIYLIVRDFILRS